MSIQFHDRAPVSGTHRTSNGFLAADARVSRTGIQIYTGREAGKPELATVRVYRSPEEVFAPAAMASAAHKPLTVDHPARDVDAATWKATAVGWTGDAPVRDGETLRIPMMIADAAAIADIASGKRELSCGYRCELDWTAGRTPSGEVYDARQVGIRLNHVAIVAAGRAGAECRIGDAAGGKTLRDAAGLPVTLTDVDTGQTLKLNADLIAAIEAEATRVGLSVDRYVREVLRYSTAGAALAGNPS